VQVSRSRHRRPRKKKRKKDRRPRTGTGEALYGCLGCGHRWYQKPGMVTCPLCGHIYVKWMNYDEMMTGGAFDD
jgi:rubrerythrin